MFDFIDSVFGSSKKSRSRNSAQRLIDQLKKVEERFDDKASVGLLTMVQGLVKAARAKELDDNMKDLGEVIDIIYRTEAGKEFIKDLDQRCAEFLEETASDLADLVEKLDEGSDDEDEEDLQTDWDLIEAQVSRLVKTAESSMGGFGSKVTNIFGKKKSKDKGGKSEE